MTGNSPFFPICYQHHFLRCCSAPGALQPSYVNRQNMSGFWSVVGTTRSPLRGCCCSRKRQFVLVHVTFPINCVLLVYPACPCGAWGKLYCSSLACGWVSYSEMIPKSPCETSHLIPHWSNFVFLGCGVRVPMHSCLAFAGSLFWHHIWLSLFPLAIAWGGWTAYTCLLFWKSEITAPNTCVGLESTVILCFP